MTIDKILPVLLIMICVLGSCKTPAVPVYIRAAPCPLIVGKPSCILLHLSKDPRVDQKDLHVWKRPSGTSEDEGEVPGKGDFICEGMYKSQTKDLDFHFPKGYTCIWNSDKLILTIFIEEVGPQHEGAYVAEYGVTEFSFHLKVLAAPPSTQAPDTTTDGVKDSSAAAPPSTQAPDTTTDGVKDSSAADAHSKDWKQAFWVVTGLLILVIALLIALVIAVGLVIVFRAYWNKRKMSAVFNAAFKRKTDEEETSPLDPGGQNQTPGDASETNLEAVAVHENRNHRGQDQTSGNASGTPFRYFNVQRRGKKNHRPGSGRTRIADQTASTEGRAGSGAVQPDSENDNNVIANTPSTVPRGEVRRRGVTPRTRGRVTWHGDCADLRSTILLSDQTASTEGRAGCGAGRVQPDPGNDGPVTDSGNHGTAQNMCIGPGSGHTRLADKPDSTEGRAGSGAVQPDPGSDDIAIAMENHDIAQSSVHRGEIRRQEVTPRTRRSVTWHGDCADLRSTILPGSGRTRIADQPDSTEGRAGSGALKPDPGNDNNVIANAPSTVPRGEVRRH